MPDQIQLGDVGTKILITIRDSGVIVNLSGAATKDIVITRPDRTTVTRTAVFETDGTDGKIYYLLQASDYKGPGVYKVQGSVTSVSGWSGRTKIGSFLVDEVLT